MPWWRAMCHGHWMHDRLIAGEPLEDLELDADDHGDEPEDEAVEETIAAPADD